MFGMGTLVGDAMDLLTPKIADVVAAGLSLSGEVTAEELGLSEADAVIRAPLAVSMDLAKADGLITVTGVVEGTIVRQCVRCLREYDDPLVFSIRAAYAPEAKTAQRHPKQADPKKTRLASVKAGEESDEELGDQYHYQGDHVELAPMVREHVILAAPMQPLCKEDCAGLCMSCGKDLNEGPCLCAAEPPATTFRVVRNTKQQTGNHGVS
jgi:DUF177 domain-containing protein